MRILPKMAATGGSTLEAGFGMLELLVSITIGTFVVAGLTPSTSYGVTAAVTANGKTVTLTPGGAGSTTDTAGLLKVSI